MSSNIITLKGLYYERVPLSLLVVGDVYKQLTSLLKDFTFEELYFSINYLSKEYPFAIREHLDSIIRDLWKPELEYRFINAKLAREVRALEEENAQYDSRNTIEGTDTPQWFRKSFDKHLFE